MLIHAFRAHAGKIITTSTHARIVASGCGICCMECCDSLRKHMETYYRKCNLYAPLITFRHVNVIPNCSTCPELSQSDDPTVPTILFRNSKQQHKLCINAEVLEHCEERVDELSSHTMLSPSEQFRHKLTCLTAYHIKAINKDDVTARLVQRSM